MLNRLYMAEKALSILRSGNAIPYPEPQGSVRSQWDFLLQEMTWMSKDYYEERRWKIYAARRLSQMVQNYWRKKMLNLERHISSKCSALIQSFWLGVADNVDSELIPNDLKPYTMVVQPAPLGEDGQVNASKRRLYNYCLRQFERSLYECGKLNELTKTANDKNKEKNVENVSENEIPASPMSIDIDHDNEGCKWVVDEDLLLQLDPLVFVKTAIPTPASSTEIIDLDKNSNKGSAGNQNIGSSTLGSTHANTSASNTGNTAGNSSKSSSNNSAITKYSEISDLFNEFSKKQETVVDLSNYRKYLENWADTVQVLLQGPGIINTRAEYRPPNLHLDSKNYLIAPRSNFLEMEDISLILSLFVLAVDHLPAFLNRYMASSPSNVVYRSSGGMISGPSSHESMVNDFNVESKRKSRRRAASSTKKMSGVIPPHIQSSVSMPHGVSGGIALPQSSAVPSVGGAMGGVVAGGAVSASGGISAPSTVPMVGDQSTSFDILAYADTWDTSEDIILVYFVSQYSSTPSCGVLNKKLALTTNWNLIALSHNYFFGALYGRMKTAKQCQERWSFLNRDETDGSSIERVEKIVNKDKATEEEVVSNNGELSGNASNKEAASTIVMAEGKDTGNDVTKGDIDRLMKREKQIRIMPNLNKRYIIDNNLLRHLKEFSKSLGDSEGSENNVENGCLKVASEGVGGELAGTIDSSSMKDSKELEKMESNFTDGEVIYGDKLPYFKKRIIPKMTILDLIERSSNERSKTENHYSENNLASNNDNSTGSSKLDSQNNQGSEVTHREVKSQNFLSNNGEDDECTNEGKKKRQNNIDTISSYQRQQLELLSSIVSKFGANMRKRSLQNQQFQDSFQITSYLQTIQQNYGSNILQDGVLPPHQSHANLVAHVNQMLNQHIESTMANYNNTGGGNAGNNTATSTNTGGVNINSNNAGTSNTNSGGNNINGNINNIGGGNNVVGNNSNGVINSGSGGPSGSSNMPNHTQGNSGTQMGGGSQLGSSNFTPLPSGIPAHLLAPGNLPSANSVEEYLSRLPGIDIQLKLIDYSLDRYRQSTMGGRYGGTGILMSTSSTCRKPQLPEFLLQRSVINSGANSGIVSGGQQGANIHGAGQHVGMMPPQQGMIHQGGGVGGGIGCDQQVPLQQSSYTPPVVSGQPGQMILPNNQMIKMKKREINQKQVVAQASNIKRRKTNMIPPSSQPNSMMGPNGVQGEMIQSHGRVGMMQGMPPHMGGAGQGIPQPHSYPHSHHLQQQQPGSSSQLQAQQYHPQQQHPQQQHPQQQHPQQQHPQQQHPQQQH
ncbi:HSA family protein, partial [Cryptosporidium meleagridis]